MMSPDPCWIAVVASMVGDTAPSTAAADQPTAQEPITVEMLRLAIPAALQDVWFNAETEVWKPWLEQQPACLGGDLHSTGLFKGSRFRCPY